MPRDALDQGRMGLLRRPCSITLRVSRDAFASPPAVSSAPVQAMDPTENTDPPPGVSK